MPNHGASDTATGTGNSLLYHLQKAVLLRDGGGLTDGQLLERFLARHEESAFEALVRRHGPMVFGVCRRVLHNPHDAEDAFQATFLVLVRKAASIVSRELVANWLYEVAYRTALKAKAAATRSRLMEKQVKAMPEPLTEPEGVWNDLRPLLDQELQRLPLKYRAPVVLCHLEGRTRKEAARELGIPEGTLSSRLATARKRLADRLARRGLVLSAGCLALALSQDAASACVPAPLVGSTVTAATLSASGQATAGVISAKVAALTEGVLQAMLMTKLKIATVLLLALGIIGTGAGVVVSLTPAAEQDDNGKPRLEQRGDAGPVAGLRQADQKDAGQQNQKDDQQNQKDDGQKNDKDDGQKNQKDDGQKNDKDDGQKNQKDDGDSQGVVKALDASKNTITLTVRREGKDTDQTFSLGKSVQVQVGGKAAALSDVKAGMRVALNLSQDKKLVVGIKEAKGQQDKGDGNNKKDGQK